MKTTIKFSRSNPGELHPKSRRWDIFLSHNSEKVGEINKDFSDALGRHPRYTLDIMGTIIQEGWHFECGVKSERFYQSLFEVKEVARAILKDKEFVISILTRQREKQITRSVNQAWSVT